MLQLTGENGKSIIINAIQQYNNARVYAYDKEPIPFLDYHFMSSKEFSVEEFCESVYTDINNLEDGLLPVRMVVLYTNLEDINIVSELWYCAEKLEKEGLAVTTVVASK